MKYGDLMPYLLADTHVQTNEQYKLLINWIHKLAEDDDVILLGDILDFTRIPYTELDYMIDDFDHPHIHYIYGNHDIIAPQLGFKCYEQYKYDDITFEHGHRYEALLRSTGFTSPDEYNELYKHLCYNLNTDNLYVQLKAHIQRMVIHRKRNLHKPEMSRELFKLISKIGNIVLGHVHYEIYSKIRRVLFCDDARIPDISVSRRTAEKVGPMGYFLQTDTFNISRFELNPRADIRSALDAKRTCIYD